MIRSLVALRPICPDIPDSSHPVIRWCDEGPGCPPVVPTFAKS